MISTNNNNTSACSESSSFECIDVALENHKEVNRNTKTVPKRKIQLKRRDNAENHANEKDNTQSTPSWPRDTIQRQHSTPAAFHQSSHGSETKSGPTEQRQKLQKSVSLDETFSKTKMASCIIKNILLKRMQHEQNFHSVDIPDQTFCAIKTDGKANNIDCLTSCVKEECTEINEGNLATVSLIGSHADFQTDSQTISSIKEHISVSSKILPKLTSKHSFNPLLGGVGRTQFQESCTEIAACSETEKKEKLNPSKEGTGEKLSCDSAKGKTWNLSAVSSGAVGKQARVKSTPEECVNAQAAQQQHCVKKQNVEKQEIPGEKIENTQSLYANIVDKVLPRSALCNLRKGQQNGEGELRPLGQSVNMGIQSQGKFKAIAPVHVVRDMRSLVKNTYSLSFRGPTEAVQELDVLSFATAGTHPVIGKRENKVTGHKQKKKLHVPTLPLALDRNIDALSLENTSSECSSKTRSILESNDKIPYTGFTKVSPISAAQTNSCALSNSQEAQNSTTATSQTNVQHSNKYTKKATCSRKQIRKGTFINTYKNEQLADSKNPECEKPLYLMQPFTSASLYLSPTQTSDKQGGFKPSDQVCPAQKDGEQSSGLPAKSQGSAGPPCILTVAPAPVFPSYFYKTNVLSYQTLSPNMGTVSYVQGPVLLQTPPYKLAASASGSIPLKKTLSVEESLLSQPYTTDGYPVPQESSKQMENGDTSQKMSYPDTQPCSAFITTLGAEGIHGGASILYPETSVRQHVSNPRHRLLDPETGQCFYVDMPHLPQWKMLFDPETCQYVEVVVPQQTLPTTVLTTPCALPYPSLNIPGMYTPHACLSYVQTHQQVPPPPPPEP
ncbi:hypothetical protein Baya_4021 [Bagarius yarrelli]|uniref:DUF4585 domain-containing protein n=1 Tax=Bagarius yarrelli TaxID=175774 RepID=A0A556TXB2_BAGYA|nr:hypothetical protein Baya_4021 [Bagarius yarrelli]